MPDGKDCEGTWRETRTARVMRCSGCGEIMVIIGGQVYNFHPSTTHKAAMKDARAQRRSA